MAFLSLSITHKLTESLNDMQQMRCYAGAYFLHSRQRLDTIPFVIRMLLNNWVGSRSDSVRLRATKFSGEQKKKCAVLAI